MKAGERIELLLYGCIHLSHSRFYMLAEKAAMQSYTFYKKGVLGRYINLMRPFHHYALRTTHYAFNQLTPLLLKRSHN